MNEPTLEERVAQLEQELAATKEHLRTLGQAIAEIKEMHHAALTEVKILKEGGNL